MSGQFIFANDVQTTLAAGITATDTTLVVSSTVNLPVLEVGQQCPGVLGANSNFEIVYVTAINSATLTITRGQENTSAQPWGLGTQFMISATAGSLAALQASVTVVPTNTGTLGSYEQPFVEVWPAPAGAITLTVVPSTRQGQRIRVYGCDYPVTVDAAMSFPDGSTASSITVPNKDSGVELVMGVSGFRAQTFGQVIVANASESNQAVPLGQVPQVMAVGNRKAAFTSGGTFTVPANITQIWASGCAGGGGGGSSYTDWSGGAGGGYGQWVLNQPITVTPGDTLTIALGAAGQGGQTYSEVVSGVTVYTTVSGTNGGNTTITNSAGTALLTLAGGAGGASPSSNTNSVTDPCPGGVGYPYGGSGNYAGGSSCGGAGASGPFGGGGCAVLQNEVNLVQAQLNASGFGAGGAGGADLAPSGALNLGGNGAPGILILEW